MDSGILLVMARFVYRISVRPLSFLHSPPLPSPLSLTLTLCIELTITLYIELDDDLHSHSPSPSSNGGERSKSSIPRGWPGSQPPPSEQNLHDGSKAVRELGLEMTPRGKTVWDTWGSLERLRGV